jgi:N-formylmaleamate deformylase
MNEASPITNNLTALLPSGWQSDFIETADGSRLHYLRTGGDKTPLLLLHGFQSAGITWLRTAQAFAPDYDVIMPDFRGHGQSSGSEKGFSAEILTDDIVTLIQALKLKAVIAAGHSMGGEIAGRLAAAHPNMVRALVLVDAPLSPFNLPPISLENPPPWMQPILNAMQAIKTQPPAEQVVTVKSLIPPGSATWHETDYQTFAEAAAQFELATFNERVDYQLVASGIIAQVTCPILMLTARAMPGNNIEANVAAATSQWQNGQHIHFYDSGHFIPFEQFEKFVDVVGTFLKRVG